MFRNSRYNRNTSDSAWKNTSRKCGMKFLHGWLASRRNRFRKLGLPGSASKYDTSGDEMYLCAKISWNDNWITFFEQGSVSEKIDFLVFDEFSNSIFSKRKLHSEEKYSTISIYFCSSIRFIRNYIIFNNIMFSKFIFSKRKPAINKFYCTFPVCLSV